MKGGREGGRGREGRGREGGKGERREETDLKTTPTVICPL